MTKLHEPTPEPQPPAWQVAWREGFLPSLSDAGLLALKTALENDDPRLIQGLNTDPPPLNLRPDEPLKGACAICFAAWQGDRIIRVGEIEDYFAQTCFDADFNLGEPTACRRFLNWYDNTPREVMRRALLAEITVNLVARVTVMPAQTRLAA